MAGFGEFDLVVEDYYLILYLSYVNFCIIPLLILWNLVVCVFCFSSNSEYC
ncbi:hypothetical protein M6B38_363575 [Iris pallida]|uniref:NADH dehydrogenase subunit 1 n=1 Tax=Iris pallida TaxID=29817 RepID=A0AAX6GJ10_IRIPA|nr:hypothetical protein M6B38_363575 [Iris pallida]